MQTINVEANLTSNPYRCCKHTDNVNERLQFIFPPLERSLPITYSGLKQTLYVHFRTPKNPYYSGPIVTFTKVPPSVSLESFYDYGRIPLTFGGNGRVLWMGQKGSKWLTFRTWDYYRWCVLDRDNGTCKRCGKVITTKDSSGRWQQKTFVCDHILPLYKGGRDWWEDSEMKNFQTLCEECNKIKTAKDMEAFWKRKKENPFNVSLNVPWLTKVNFGALDCFFSINP